MQESMQKYAKWFTKSYGKITQFSDKLTKNYVKSLTNVDFKNFLCYYYDHALKNCRKNEDKWGLGLIISP